ncbi:hypothetical protein K7X08_017303 [Anisodus acutangulus]|uniref:Protein SMG9 n=1 Tax=Anisodus acutangulus TaxID=402998 RepID=A0A9Q1LXF6_9SOLA|nr:hypothetical protein K7X08_017303 [Anisodus acutangulus]
MAGSGGNPSSSVSHQAPKILLAKPGVVNKLNRPRVGSVNLLSDTFDFQTDRFLPFVTDNTEFSVVGIIGPPGVGKSTIMNEIYGGFDHPHPFPTHTQETRAMGKHCTVGIEPRVIPSERIILLDTQPVFSPSVLAEMIRRPDGELGHEMMSIQLGVLLSSICHVTLVVSDGLNDASMWQLMSTVDLLKHGIPDPSLTTLDNNTGQEYMSRPVFVHTTTTEHVTPSNIVQLNKALTQFICSDNFKLFVIPFRNNKDEAQYESHISALWNLRDQVLSMRVPTFSRTVSERDWLKNSAKIWEIIRNSPIIADYSTTLQTSGMFRR